jgi:hypothetical protein
MVKPMEFVNVGRPYNGNRSQSTTSNPRINSLFDWTPLSIPDNRNESFVADGANSERDFYLTHLRTATDESAEIADIPTNLITPAAGTGFITNSPGLEHSPGLEQQGRNLHYLQAILDEALDIVDASVTGTLITHSSVASEQTLPIQRNRRSLRLKRHDHGKYSGNRQ